jgi:hypothetical protein
MKRSQPAAAALVVALGCGAPQDPAREERRMAASSSDRLAEERLASLPYAGWVPTRPGEASGVTRLVAARVAPGLNLYCTRNLAEARLYDELGRIVHRWVGGRRSTGWGHVEPLPDGDLLVLEKEGGILRVGWDSRLRWSLQARSHHDIAVAADGRILVPIWVERVVDEPRGSYVALDPQILVLSSAGEEIERLSLWRHFAGEIDAEQIDAAVEWTAAKRAEGADLDALRMRMDGPGDLLHLNAVELLRRDVDGIAAAGDLLVTIRELDLVAILDSRLERVKWSWGPGVLDGPHDPSLLADGRILLFDNGRRRGSSRVLEVDPRTGEVTWIHPPEEGPRFFSIGRGGAQRLANGNTLITESGKGRAFEVTRDGELVWEFLSPDERWNDRLQRKQRGSIYRLRRLPPEELEALGLVPYLRVARGGSRLESAAGGS